MFPNTHCIRIPDPKAKHHALPYPAPIKVSGLTGKITKITVTLRNMSYTYPDNLNIMLVGPSGQNIVLMSDAGGNFSVQKVTLTFDDNADQPLPNKGKIQTGYFKPSHYRMGFEPFPLPAPKPSAATKLSTFNGTDPNGTWKLFIFDRYHEESHRHHHKLNKHMGYGRGAISSGWALTITTDGCKKSTHRPIISWD
jgi:hypothetical protein